ncbi:MAG: rna polymerase sigma factor region 2 [Chthoniobacteraceae bacterium]|nr:rna polymerase sigma factor region 2 [Chthoniobacteraceae bacterium]
MSSSEPPGESLRTSISLLNRLRDPADHASWERFHARYEPLIVTVARKAGLGHAEVEDVVQETLIEVAKQMPNFCYDVSKGTFKGWLLTILRRRVYNHWRSQSYQAGALRLPRAQSFEPCLMEIPGSDEIELEKIWDAEWRAHTIQEALKVVKTKVKPLQFQLFQLHVLKGISAQEVAKRLGVKLMQVYWARLHVGSIFQRAREAAEKGG